MPITADVIKQSEALKDLPDDKVEAFVILATNVFKEEIDTYAGTTKRRWEEDIKNLYGAEKPDPKMPAHEFLKTAWTERETKFKAELEAAKSNPTAAEDLKVRYEAEIEKLRGEMKNATLQGSELLRKDIDEYKQRIKDLNDEKEGVKKDSQAKLRELESKYLQSEREKLHIKVGFEKVQALNGVEFDPAIPPTALQTTIDARWGELLTRATPEHVELDGKIVTQWRDKEGKILRNPSKNAEPYTTQDLLLEELKDVLKKGRSQNGAGTSAGAGGGSSINADFSAARTQVEFDDAVANALLAQGLKRGTTAFLNKQKEIVTANADLRSKLPLR